MLVPETSMHENHLSFPGEHYVGRTGKVSIMKAEPIPHGMNQSPNSKLNFGV